MSCRSASRPVGPVLCALTLRLYLPVALLPLPSTACSALPSRSSLCTIVLARSACSLYTCFMMQSCFSSRNTPLGVEQQSCGVAELRGGTRPSQRAALLEAGLWSLLSVCIYMVLCRLTSTDSAVARPAKRTAVNWPKPRNPPLHFTDHGHFPELRQRFRTRSSRDSLRWSRETPGSRGSSGAVRNSGLLRGLSNLQC